MKPNGYAENLLEHRAYVVVHGGYDHRIVRINDFDALWELRERKQVERNEERLASFSIKFKLLRSS